MIDRHFAQLKELFQRAIELPEDERQALLTTECANDLGLKIEVVALLDELEPSEQFLQASRWTFGRRIARKLISSIGLE